MINRKHISLILIVCTAVSLSVLPAFAASDDSEELNTSVEDYGSLLYQETETLDTDQNTKPEDETGDLTEDAADKTDSLDIDGSDGEEEGDDDPVSDFSDPDAAADLDNDTNPKEDISNIEDMDMPFTMSSLLLNAGDAAYTTHITASTDTKTGTTYSLEVTYPAEITTGNEVTFTMNASSTNSDSVFKYRIYGLTTYDGTSWVNVYDISAAGHSNYSDDNTWTFTFAAAGTYAIRFSVMDMEANYYFNSSTTQQPDGSWIPGIPLYVTSSGIAMTVDEKADAVAAECIAAVGENASDYTKALWLNDWLIANAEYDYSYSYSSAEGVLLRGTGTCESYHRAYVMLLNRVGIQTGRVEGYLHVWTAVKMDGQWYQVDVTWNDGGAAAFDGIDLNRLYFGLTDEIISLDTGGTHTHSPVSGCESDSLEDNYYIKSGEIKKFSDEYISSIKSAIDEGNASLALTISKSKWPENYKNVIYNLVAYQLSSKESFSKPVSVTYKDNTLSVLIEQPGSLSVEVPGTASGDIVYIDGVAAVVGTDGKVSLCNSSAKIVTVYSQNTSDGDVHSQYPTGMTAYKLEYLNGTCTAEHIAELDNILQYSGSSIRITGVKGIRMITSVPTDKKKTLISSSLAGYKLLEYGTLVAWDSDLNGASLTFESLNVKYAYAYKKGVADPVFNTTGGLTQYTNVLVGFSLEQCSPDLAMRPYMILETDDGAQITLYGGTVHRSIGYIAWQNRNVFSPGSASYAYIWDIIHGVYGDAYDSEYKG